MRGGERKFGCTAGFFVVTSSASFVSALRAKSAVAPLLLLSPANPLALGFAGAPKADSPLYTKGPLYRPSPLPKLPGLTGNVDGTSYRLHLPHVISEKKRHYRSVWQVHSARDFPLKKAIFPQEYFVYFKGKWCIFSEKDPAKAEATAVRYCLKYKQVHTPL